MIDIVGFYCDLVLKPTEDYVEELRAKVCSKNFFDWLSRGLYKEYLEKAEELLYERYTKLGVIIQEEIEFDNEIKEKLEMQK